MFFYYIIFSLSYESFADKIQTQTYSGQSGEELEIFTPCSPLIAIISYIDISKTDVKIASPLQNSPIDIGSSRSFYFPKGKSKFIIHFKEQSSIVINYASISTDICLNGISVIVNETHELNIDFSSSSFVDKCYLFAFASNKHQFKVTENNLQPGSTLCAFHESSNGAAYQCYHKGNPTDPSFIPGDGSISPWLFRYTKLQASEESDSIKISLRAPVISTISSDTTSFVGLPTKFEEPPITKYNKKWWIPIVGSIAPTFLLISWIYTFIILFKKRNATII